MTTPSLQRTAHVVANAAMTKSHNKPKWFRKRTVLILVGLSWLVFIVRQQRLTITFNGRSSHRFLQNNDEDPRHHDTASSSYDHGPRHLGSAFVVSKNNDFSKSTPTDAVGDSKGNVETKAPPTQSEQPQIVNNQDSNDNLLCYSNPYAPSLKHTLQEIGQRADAWLDNLSAHLQRAEDETNEDLMGWNHARFFPFGDGPNITESNNPWLAPCQNMTCLGSSTDEDPFVACANKDSAKIVCGLHELMVFEQSEEEEAKCIVYSIGGNNYWGFEQSILETTPCQVHTFDCTGHISRFKIPRNPRLHFHHKCLGAESVAFASQPCNRTSSPRDICGPILTLQEIQTELQHHEIQLLKMDIEGFEWPVLQQWPELSTNNGDQAASSSSLQHVALPMQILVEIHYRTWVESVKQQSPPAHGQMHKDKDWKFAKDMVELQAHLLRMGYAVAAKDDNRYCKHCSELTLVRFRCHEKSEIPIQSTE